MTATSSTGAGICVVLMKSLDKSSVVTGSAASTTGSSAIVSSTTVSSILASGIVSSIAATSST